MHILYMPCMSLKILVVVVVVAVAVVAAAAAVVVVKMTMCENVADTLDFME